jgi:uncharacterized protein (TIGR03067 family)
MPDITATHPTDEALEAFALGMLDPNEAPALEEHLPGCELCMERADSVAPDTLVQLLVAAQTRVDEVRSAAQTPTLDGSATPSFAPTHAWDGKTLKSAGDADAPAALAGHPKYRVVRCLGIGGMGTVWLAEHEVMHRPVAIKLIRPDLLARPGATARFLREVRAAAKLQHPNIVTAFDAESVGDSCLLVMEYVPGETLADRLKNGPLPVAEACQAIRDAARGLAHAHAAGLVHRDVKPHNLIRATDGTVKVLDFGLAGVGAGELVAADGEGLTGAGMVVGTPDYIAPEQIADPHSADARADIYGLGCTAYHLLSGRSPVADGSIVEKLKAQEARTPAPIPGLPRELVEVLAKMQAKRPEDRYQTADDVVAALDRCIRQAGPRRRRNRRRFAVAAASVLFAGLLAAAGVVFKIQRDNQEITIATDDPDIEVVMKRKGEIVLIRSAKTGQTWSYDTIKHQIGLVDQPDGLTLALPENEAFVLRRQGNDVFRVKRVAATVPKEFELVILPNERGQVIRPRITSAALSTDGRTAVTGTSTSYAFVWEGVTGRGANLDLGIFFCQGVAISGDGKTALTGTTDKKAIVWDTQPFQRRSLDGPQGAVGSVALSKDGVRALTGSSDKTATLWNLSFVAKTQFPEHGAPVGVALSGDGTTALTTAVGLKGAIIWRAANANRLGTLLGHMDEVISLALSDNGKIAITGSNDKTAILWETSTGKKLHTWQGHSVGLNSVALSGDGKTALMASDKTAILWDAGTGNKLQTFAGHIGQVLAVALSGDGKTALTGSTDGVSRLWDTATGRELCQLIIIDSNSWLVITPDGLFDGPRSSWTYVAFRAKGSQELLNDDDTTRQKFHRTGLLKDILDRHLKTERIPPAVKTDKELILGTWRGVAVEMGGQKMPQTILDMMKPTLTITADKVTSKAEGDGAREFLNIAVKNGLLTKDAAAIAEKGGEGIYHLDSAKSPKTIDIVTLGGVRKTALGIYSLDGDTLKLCLSIDPDNVAERPKEFVTKEGELRVIVTFKRQAPDRIEEFRHFEDKHDVMSVAFAPDSKTLAMTYDGWTVRLWDVAEGQERLTLKGHTQGPRTIAFSPDRKTIATGAHDRTIRLWDLESGKSQQILEGHDHFVTSVAYSADGAKLVSGSDDGTARIWDTITGKEVYLLEGHTAAVSGVAFSPIGDLVASGGKDNTVKVWNTATGKLHHTFKGHVDEVRSLAFSPDGKTLASGSRDTTVKLWDVATKTETATLRANQGAVYGVAFSPDGKTLAAGGGFAKSGNVSLWDISIRAPWATVTEHSAYVHSVAFSPDGKWLATGSGDTTARLWRLPPNRVVPVPSPKSK